MLLEGKWRTGNYVMKTALIYRFADWEKEQNLKSLARVAELLTFKIYVLNSKSLIFYIAKK